MPRAPKICCEAGCFNLVYDGKRRCEDCYKPWGGATRHTGVIHREMRENTEAHRRLKSRVLGRAHHRCQIAYSDICIGTATHCDRIDNSDGYSDANCQAACEPCHGRKSSLEGHAAMGHRTPNQ